MLRKSPGLLALLVAGVWLLAPSVWAQPIGVIDQPTAGQTVSGVVKVSGFVLDFNTAFPTGPARPHGLAMK